MEQHNLSEVEEEARRWMLKTVVTPWQKHVCRLSGIDRREPPGASETGAGLPSGSVPSPQRPVRRAWLPGLTRQFLGRNPSLFVLVVNQPMISPIHASFSRSVNGTYTDCVIFDERLSEAWAMESTRLVHEGRLRDAYRLFQNWVPEQPETSGFSPGVFAVISINAFIKLQQAWEKSDGGKPLSFAAWGLDALGQIEREKLLKFHPDVNLARGLRLLLPFLRPVPLRMAGFLARHLPI